MELLSILKDVVAYVEVRSSNDNRSEAVRQKLEELGATVEASFTDRVTHVVFKEGLKRTWAKAMKRRLPLVSVSWLDSCKQNEKRMPEKDFPTILPDEVSSPLPRLNQAPRWKKMKSMQPCDFDEEMARSAERGEKRRRRVLMANRFKLSEEQTPPSASSAPILALDTQARSPMFATLSRPSSPIPDTPPSMKERLDKMRREQRQILAEGDDSTTPRPVTEIPVQKRLFVKLGSDLMSTEDSSDDEEKTSMVVKKLIQSLDSNSESGSQSPSSRKDGEPDCNLEKCKGSPVEQNLRTAKGSIEIVDSKILKPGRTKATESDMDVTSGHRPKSLRRSRYACSSPVLIGDIAKEQISLASHENQPVDHNFFEDVKSRSARLKLHNPRSMTNALSPKNDNIGHSISLMKPSQRNQEDGGQSNKEIVKTITDHVQHHQGDPYASEPSLKSAIPKQGGTSNADNELVYFNRCEKKDPEPKKRRQSSIFSKKSSGLAEKNLISAMPSTGAKNSIFQEVETPKVNSSEAKDSKIISLTPSNGDAPLKAKTTKKKKKLLSEPAFSTAFLPSAVKTTHCKNSPEAPPSSKSHEKCSGSDSKGDVSFLFGESNREKTQERRKSRRLSSVKSSSTKSDSSKSSDKVEIQTESKNQASFVNEEPGAKLGQSKNHTTSAFMLDDSVVKNNTLGTSMSVLYGGNNTTVANSTLVRSSSRRSIDEFSLETKRKLKNTSKPSSKISLPKIEEDKTTSSKDNADHKKEQASKISIDKREKKGSHSSKRMRSNSSCEDHSSQRPVKKRKGTDSVSSEDADTTLNKSSASYEAEGAPAGLRHAKSLVMDQSFMCIHKKRPNSLVMTSLHREEQELVYSVVKNLKTFHMTNNVEASTTHIVLESLESGGWLSEEDYELELYSSAKKSRCDRQNVGPGYKVDLFSKIGPIFVSNNTIPPRKDLVHLVNLCSGHVTGSESRAAVRVGNDHDPEKLVIFPTWILDSIIKLECLPTDDYIVPRPTSFSQRESSPEF